MAQRTRVPAAAVLTLALAAGAGVAGTVVAATAAPAPAVRVTQLVVRPDGVWRVAADGTNTARLRGTRGAVDVAWAPNGRELAFERAGVVHLLNADGSGIRAVLRGSSPAWSPDGRRLAVVRDGRIVVARRNGRAVHALTDGPADAAPAWAPGGGRIAFVRDGVVSVVSLATRAVSAVAPGADPAWSPDGRRIAFATPSGIASAATDGSDVRIETLSAGDRAPAWASDMTTLDVVQQDNTIVTHAQDGTRSAIGPGTAFDRRAVPVRPELLPDLDQRAPSRVAVAPIGGRYKLGFASAVDNVGRGPLWIRGTRAGAAMHARQLVRVRNGAVERHLDAGAVKYTWSPTHSHWHLLRFVSYELRRADDDELVVSDRKSGFCLADHYGEARNVRPGPPVFLGNCRAGQPGARSVDQGSSVGYTDRYPPHFHGQNLDLRDVPAGIYVLVHRANPDGRLRERRYDNNAASVRLRLTRPGGVPQVRVLRSCEGAAHC